MRDVHNVGLPRTADFSDEESDSSADEMAVPLPFITSSDETDVVSVSQNPLASLEEDDEGNA